jgi:hypothetical protein
MANAYLPFTKKGSLGVDMEEFEHQSTLYPQQSKWKPGYYNDAETVLSLDTAGYVYIPVPIDKIPAYGQISFQLNVTGTNILGGPYGGFTGAVVMQGSIDNDKWVQLSTGSLLLGAQLKDTPTASNWVVDMIAGPFAQKTSGRWPYLRLRLNYNPSAQDNSDKFVKCVLVGHR